MGRAQVVVRNAVEEDLATLAELWRELLRTGQHAASDLSGLLARSRSDDSVRLLVAEIDSLVVGAVLLVVAPTSPLNPEPLVHAFAPQVTSDARRKGVGTALMEAAVTFAEEVGIGFVGAAAFSASRDANRVFARLGLGPKAVLRVAPTASLRQRISRVRPARPADRRHVDRVLAARRGRRIARALP